MLHIKHNQELRTGNGQLENVRPVIDSNNTKFSFVNVSNWRMRGQKIVSERNMYMRRKKYENLILPLQVLTD